MAQWELTPFRDAWVEFEARWFWLYHNAIFIERVIYYPWGMNICDYDKKKINWIITVTCIPRNKAALFNCLIIVGFLQPRVDSWKILQARGFLQIPTSPIIVHYCYFSHSHWTPCCFWSTSFGPSKLASKCSTYLIYQGSEGKSIKNFTLSLSPSATPVDQYWCTFRKLSTTHTIIGVLGTPLSGSSTYKKWG